MGTKRDLAARVQTAVRSARPGIFLDAFSGMCSVGERIGIERQVWSNDTQIFASQVAHALFVSKEEPMQALTASELFFPQFWAHLSVLSQPLEKSLATEKRYITSDSFQCTATNYRYISNLLRKDYAGLPSNKYSLFTLIYADSYVGIKQAIEIDSLIAAIDHAHTRLSISEDQRRWLLLALGGSILKCACTTGHFAQFLEPNENSYRFFSKQRKRSIWETWLQSIEHLSAVGDEKWRSNNQSFNEDSITLLSRLACAKNRPAVIYADPPYTDDQYSRFYHLLETLMLYDFPEVSGKGRYRTGRYTTPFSLKSKVVTAFDNLAAASAATGADMVLSYPSNGLLYETGLNPKIVLKKHFRKVECRYAIPHSHSTMGGSKGYAKEIVTEHIYMATV